MARALVNSALEAIRGRVGNLIFKQYDYGTVVTRVPRMNKVVFSAKQLAHQQRVKAAGKFYREVLANEELRKKYERLARRRGIPLPAVTLQAFMKGARNQRSAETA